MKRFAKFGGIAALLAFAATSTANAALTAPTIDTADFETIAGAIVLAAGVFYSIRKAVRLLG